mmetsp:Transcript_13378/g.36956  ORF Transcript_13378/g.36956 Transcript_13378/m.36956 type:complete len:240 (+) Transcript_13378:316-1035(+)
MRRLTRSTCSSSRLPIQSPAFSWTCISMTRSRRRNNAVLMGSSFTCCLTPKKLLRTNTYAEWTSAALYARMATEFKASSKLRPVASAALKAAASFLAKRLARSFMSSTRRSVSPLQLARRTGPKGASLRYSTEPTTGRPASSSPTALMRKRATWSERMTCSPSTVAGSANSVVRSQTPLERKYPWPPQALRQSSMLVWAHKVLQTFRPDRVACSSGISAAAASRSCSVPIVTVFWMRPK